MASSNSPSSATSAAAVPSSNTSTSTAPSSSPSSSSAPTSSNAPTSASSTSATSSSASSSASSSQSSSSQSSSTQLIPTQVVSSSGGTPTTITTFITPTVVTTPVAQNNTTSNSFFSNKGAVAGVFTVVGLIVVAFVVALVVNTVRRRRAQKFDRDVAEAAAEAAASSRAPFDEFAYPSPGGGGGGGGYGYSDNSHGTFQLPPLSPHNEAYGMTEMAQYDPYAAGAASLTAAAAVGGPRSRTESEPGTPGLAGVGAGTLVREPSKRAPYHAFAGPGLQPQDLQPGGGSMRGRRGNQDVLEAAGLAAIAGTAGYGATVARRTSETTTQHTHFSGRSQFGAPSGGGGGHPTPLQPGYPVESYYPQRNQSRSPDPFAGYPPIVAAPKTLPNPYEARVASPPLPASPVEQSDEHGEASSPTALRSDEQRMSYQDDADYSQGQRVLRVANE